MSFEELKKAIEKGLRRMWSESDTQMIMSEVDEKFEAFQRDFILVEKKQLQEQIERKSRRIAIGVRDHSALLTDAKYIKVSDLEELLASKRKVNKKP